MESIIVDTLLNIKPNFYGREAVAKADTRKRVYIPKEDVSYIENSKDPVSLEEQPDGMVLYEYFLNIYYNMGLSTTTETYLPFERRNNHLILYLTECLNRYKRLEQPIDLSIIISAFIREIGYIYDLFVNGVVRNKRIVTKVLLRYSLDNIVDCNNIEEVVHNIRMRRIYHYKDKDDFEQDLYITFIKLLNGFLKADRDISGGRYVTYFMDYYHNKIISLIDSSNKTYSPIKRIEIPSGDMDDYQIEQNNGSLLLDSTNIFDRYIMGL